MCGSSASSTGMESGSNSASNTFGARMSYVSRKGHTCTCMWLGECVYVYKLLCLISGHSFILRQLILNVLALPALSGLCLHSMYCSK